MTSTATTAAATTSATSTSASTNSKSSSSSKTSPAATGLVMQVILRRDLSTSLGWPVGPLMAQAAHAATAVQHVYAHDSDMKRYLHGDDGEGFRVMRKAVLEVPDESALLLLATRLDALVPKIGYHLWIEEPEHIPTALAIVPNKRPKALKRVLDEVGCTLWK